MSHANETLASLIDEAGMSYSGLARRVNDLGKAGGQTLRYDYTAVTRWVKLGQTPRGNVPVLLAQVLSSALNRVVHSSDLGMSYSEAKQSAAVDHPPRPQPNELLIGNGYPPLWAAGATYPSTASEGEDMDLSRRNFMLAVGTQTVTATAFTDSKAAAAASADIDQVAHFEHIYCSLRDTEDIIGSRAIAPFSFQQLAVMEALHNSGNAQPGLLAVQSQLAESIAWLYQDQRDWPGAQFWTDRALHWAIAAGGGNLAAHTLARKASIAADMGQGAEAINFANAAINSASPESKLVALATIHRAHAHSLTGDFSASERDYDQAAELVVADADPAIRWGWWADQHYLGVQRARSRFQAGKFAESADVTDKVANGFSTRFPRDKAVYKVRAALARAEAGDIAQAARTGSEAIAIGTGTGSARLNHGLRRLHRVLTPHHKQAAVGDFNRALSVSQPEVLARTS